MTSSAQHEIAIRPSSKLTRILLLAHAGAAALCWAVEMPHWAVAALMAAIAASAVRALRQFLKKPGAIVAIRMERGGALSLQTSDREWHEAHVLGTTFVSPYLTILNLKCPDCSRARHVIVLPDSASPEEFRLLRVWLRWQSGRPTNDSNRRPV